MQRNTGANAEDAEVTQRNTGANAEGAEVTQRTQKNTKNGFGFRVKALRCGCAPC